MLRTFQTHKIRIQQELTDAYWTFSACQGPHAGEIYSVCTPSCWENYPAFPDYRGEGIYTTTFEAEGNIRLEFKGISHTARIYLDDTEIAHHYNAYTAFSVVIQRRQKGRHTLAVKADNRFSADSALHVPNDYMSYGGISRPVVLEHLKDLYITYIHTTPVRLDAGWQLSVKIGVQNLSDKSRQIRLALLVPESDTTHSLDRIELQSHETAEIATILSFDTVAEWMPEHPNLYRIEAVLYADELPVDDYIDRFGFREVRTEGKHILLNGRPIRIKGVCLHEDHPQFGCALPLAARAADLALIKDLGANSIRAVHYPHDELFLDLCDEQGFLVWEENHARGLSLEDMQNPHFEVQAEQVLREMIPLHHNHPSIYIWGILNECASDSEYGKLCYQKQLDLIKELDPSRPRSFASCKFKTDICFGLPDVVSYNIYPLWYHDTPVKDYLDDLYQWVQSETDGRGKPFLITEIGAGGIYGYRNSHNGKWTEAYQAQTLREQIKTVLDHENCVGVYIWQFCDIRISEEWFITRPRTMNNKGLVDEYRRRKLAYDVVKELFAAYDSWQ